MTFICTETEPTVLTCPGCNGSLWCICDSRPARFSCHTGHTFSISSLVHAQRVESEHVLRGAVRALREHAVLLREMEPEKRVSGDKAQAHQASLQPAAVLGSVQRTARAGRHPARQ